MRPKQIDALYLSKYDNDNATLMCSSPTTTSLQDPQTLAKMNGVAKNRENIHLVGSLEMPPTLLPVISSNTSSSIVITNSSSSSLAPNNHCVISPISAKRIPVILC